MLVKVTAVGLVETMAGMLGVLMVGFTVVVFIQPVVVMAEVTVMDTVTVVMA